jgi:hypothetical protein
MLRPPGGGAGLSFQTEDAYVGPAWRAGPGQQQMMMHLDIRVDDLGTAGAHAIAAGAVLAEYQPQDDVAGVSRPRGTPVLLVGVTYRQRRPIPKRTVALRRPTRNTSGMQPELNRR